MGSFKVSRLSQRPAEGGRLGTREEAATGDAS